MRKWMLFFFFTLCLVLAACGKNPDEQFEEAKMQSIPSEHEGLSMKTEQTSYASDTMDMNVLIENKRDQEVMYGKHFTMEKKVEGVWRIVPFEDGAAFIEIALFVQPGETAAEAISLSLFEQPLSEGTYRIVKKIDSQAFAAEFTVKKE